MLKILEAAKLTKERLDQLLIRSSHQDLEAYQVASEIIARVKEKGFAALQEYSRKFDGAALAPEEFLVSEAEFEQAQASLDPNLKAAFQLAAKNIFSFHQFQKERLQDRKTTIMGTQVGYRYLPMESAAVYVPGGLASYPSSVLMGLIPAKIAGVENCTVVSPPSPEGKIDPAVLYCARLAGASGFLKAGGAQGIAAAAYGLLNPPASIIVGPGNRYVTAAKLILASQGTLAMDLPAGPSEVLVIADESADPVFVAADLLSQAEHGEDSCVVLLCCSLNFARATAQAIDRGLEQRPSRREIKEKSIREHSFALVFEEWGELYDFSNQYGPEHLELCVKKPELALKKIKHAGSIFLGHYAPVALGDYCSGSNHVLPTGGTSRFYSGLGVDTFLKRTTYQYPTQRSLKKLKNAIELMSRQEGLEAEHGHSVRVRFQGDLCKVM